MRVLIYGAGAIGGYLGAVLSRSGVDVTILARGATFDVIKSHGLAVDWAVGNEHLVVHPPVCTSDESDGLFDVIFVTLKSMQIASSAENIVSKLRPQGCMVMVQNGLPWWYFQGIDSPWRGVSLSSLDPNGILKKYINLSQVIGAVIHKPVMVTKPFQYPASWAATLKLSENNETVYNAIGPPITIPIDPVKKIINALFPIPKIAFRFAVDNNKIKMVR